MHTRIAITNKTRAIPFPTNPKKGDTATVIYPAKNNYRLEQFYIFDGKQWRYVGFETIDISSNN